jgi:nucleotide-binding universal stress UspA family protein
MKKLIAAFDGLQFSESTLAYAVWLAGSGEYHLVGVFLDDMLHHSYRVSELISREGGISETKREALDAKDRKARSLATERFRSACEKAGISFSIHHDRNVALRELLEESMYADLLVIDRKETLTHYAEKPPTDFIRDLLSDVQCPVLLVPSKFHQPKSAVFLYDGGPSSVHAIKMFGYLLPWFSESEAESVSARAVNQPAIVPDKRLMKEFILRHFPKTKFVVQKGFAEDLIVEYLRSRKTSSIVVLGAYRRNRVSRWFSPSLADLLMKKLHLPLFIAHNK